MNTTLTTQQRETLCETYNKEVYSQSKIVGYDTGNVFGGMRPKTYARIIRECAKALNVKENDSLVDDSDLARDFWQEVTTYIFDYACIETYRDFSLREIAKRQEEELEKCDYERFDGEFDYDDDDEWLSRQVDICYGKSKEECLELARDYHFANGRTFDCEKAEQDLDYTHGLYVLWNCSDYYVD